MANIREEYIARVISMTDERKEFVTGEDGYVYYWPEGKHGAQSAVDLRILADELDKRNAAWDKNIQEYFESQKEQHG